MWQRHLPLGIDTRTGEVYRWPDALKPRDLILSSHEAAQRSGWTLSIPTEKGR